MTDGDHKWTPIGHQILNPIFFINRVLARRASVVSFSIGGASGSFASRPSFRLFPLLTLKSADVVIDVHCFTAEITERYLAVR